MREINLRQTALAVYLGFALAVFVFAFKSYSATKSKNYLVSISGFLEITRSDGQGGYKAGVHQEFSKEVESLFSKRYRFKYHVKEKELLNTLEEIGCDNTLVILANSWGYKGASFLAREFEHRCVKYPELFILVDGVRRDLSSADMIWPVNRCVNFYQEHGVVHGREILDCENHNLSNVCSFTQRALSLCHKKVSDVGSEMAGTIILDHFKNQLD